MKMFLNFSKVFAVVLCVCLLLFTVACTPADVTNVVKQINAYLPTAISLANEVIAIVGVVDKTNPDQVASVGQTVQTDLTELEKLTNTYLAKGTSGSDKTLAWNNIVALVDTLVSDADTALLNSAGFKNSNTQADVKIALGALDAALHIIDGYVSTAQTPAAVQAKAAKRTVKLKAIVQYWTPDDRQRIERAFGTNFPTIYERAAAVGF